ncbi:MAG: cytochrome c [Gammaproteobacteria bacterium]|nr:cytochrome c [Gammaproteobacteria bacterium]
MKYGKLLFILLLMSTNTVNAALLLGDAKKGKESYNTHCTKCHGTDVFTHNNRQVKSVEGLVARVKMCNGQLKMNLDKDTLDDITSYLNESFYKFE